MQVQISKVIYKIVDKDSIMTQCTLPHHIFSLSWARASVFTLHQFIIGCTLLHLS